MEEPGPPEARREGFDSAPAAGDVRALLERTLASEAFRDSPQCIQFLRFVVDETLAGRGGDLKGYTIATRALGRPESFDPQSDPVVRVQAGRVRKALSLYHRSEGQADAFRIVLEPGDYRPRFERAAAPGRPPEPVSGEPIPQPLPPVAGRPPAGPATVIPRSRPFGRRGLALSALAAAALLVAALAAGPLPWPQRAGSPLETARQPILAGPPLVEVTAEAGETAGDREVAGVAARVRDALARFDDLVLVRDPAVAAGGGGQYRLVLARTGDGSSGNLNARLVALPDATVVWRQDFPTAAGGRESEAWRSATVRTIASELAQPYGIIPADARSRFGFEGPAGEAYRCLLGGFEYWRRADAAGHLALRTCLLAAARQDRPLPAVLAQLTYNHLEEFRHGFNPMEGDPRERARAAAERAVALAPGSARAHQALLASHFAQRRFDEAFAAGRKAIALNPFDAELMADIGARYIQTDRIDIGLPLIEEAIGQMAAPPIWARVYLALGHYGEGQRDSAARVADQIVGDSSPLALLARLLAAYHRRDTRALSEALRQLREEHPAIDRDPGAYLDRLVISPSLARRLLDSLALARTRAAE